MKNNKTKGNKNIPPMPSIPARIRMLVDRLNASDDKVFTDVLLDNPGRAIMHEQGGRYVFIDNGASVLAVAHVDTVAGNRTTYQYSGSFYENWAKDESGVYKPIPGKVDKVVVDDNVVNVDGRWINSIKLDDRLGVHILLDILPLLGINVDVLLTEDEESAMSTAQCFKPPEGKVYNWAFEFDRRGVGECVMYQYDRDKGAVRLLEKSGWYHGHGSYSDIADLDIGCVCFNFAAGYWDEHTSKCIAHYDNVMVNTRMFARFYRQNKDTRMPFTQPTYGRHYKGYLGYGNAYARQDDDYDYNGRNASAVMSDGHGTNTRGSDSYLDRWYSRSTSAPVTIRPGKDIECWYCGGQATKYTAGFTPLCDVCFGDNDVREMDVREMNGGRESQRDTPEEGTTCIYCGANDATRWDDYSGDPAPICEQCWTKYVVGNQKDEADSLFECNYCGSVTADNEADNEFPLTCKPCADFIRKNFRADEIAGMDWLNTKQDYSRTVPLLTSGKGG